LSDELAQTRAVLGVAAAREAADMPTGGTRHELGGVAVQQLTREILGENRESDDDEMDG
jgi:hypothetical protein